MYTTMGDALDTAIASYSKLPKSARDSLLAEAKAAGRSIPGVYTAPAGARKDAQSAEERAAAQSGGNSSIGWGVALGLGGLGLLGWALTSKK